MKNVSVAVLPGDGIGIEVSAVCCELLKQFSDGASEYSLEFLHLEAGAGCYQRTGEALPAEVLEPCRSADAILLGAMGLPSVRYPDGTEIAPQLDLRFAFDLYAGVRPVKPLKGLPLPLSNRQQKPINFVLVRESTEGLFASHGKGKVVDDREAFDTMKITRAVSETLFDFSFKLARERAQNGYRGKLTCVDKANVFASMAFFRKIYDEVGWGFSDVEKEHMYVDAAALNMVKQPWDMDVLVTENMFGDILSDLGAGLMGGMGMAPSADIGDNHAVFQPCHGTAPDIVGQRKANPTAMLLSGAMMLDWLGKKCNLPTMIEDGRKLEAAVEAAYVNRGLLPYELGGDSGTEAIFAAVMRALETTN